MCCCSLEHEWDEGEVQMGKNALVVFRCWCEVAVLNFADRMRTPREWTRNSGTNLSGACFPPPICRCLAFSPADSEVGLTRAFTDTICLAFAVLADSRQTRRMNPLPPPAPSSNYSVPPNDYQNAAAATAQAALSQQHVPTPSAQAAASANGRKRKASGVPGSRGVANLTPEQLAKKRANDREAQRAIRERTRNTIESLERRIKELESQQPYQDLQRVLHERDRALQECDDLRRKLAQVVNVAAGAQQQQQPNLHGMSEMFDEFLEPDWLTDDAAELAALTAQQSPLPPLQQHVQQQQQQQPTQHSPQGPGAPQQAFEQQMLHPDLRSPHASSQAGASSHAGTPVTPYPHEQTSGRGLDQDSPAQYTPPNGMSYEHQRSSSAQMHSQSNGERLGVNFLLDKTRNSNTPPPGTQPQQHYSPQQRRSEHQQSWATRLPNNGPYTCPLDSLLGEFVANRRQQLAKGVPMQDVIGPENPSFIALLNPDPALRNACHPISALLIDILSKFPDISATPEKVAVLHFMFLILRWQICPCEPCYARLPDWLEPIAEQLERPHPAWHDHLPWCVNPDDLSSAISEQSLC